MMMINTAVHALVTVLAVAIAYAFVAGELTGNNSQVDKLWSLLPIVYAWIVAGYGACRPRLVLMAVLVTLWGVRLTVNFALKGGYSWRVWAGREDYRWPVLRSKPVVARRWRWTAFNLLFISGYQNIVILLFTLPAVVALQHAAEPLGPLDVVAAGLMLAFIAIETVADIQQWRFQSRKQTMVRAGEARTGDCRKGFVDTGLWAWSRHPNYFAEQAVWVCFYLFSVAASGQWVNWSVAGCLLLMALFQGSTAFSESISAGKYPAYPDYQQRVPRFLPLGGRRTAERP